MTPVEAPLYHYVLVPGSLQNWHRKVAKIKVDQDFFHLHSVQYLKELFLNGKMPEHYPVEAMAARHRPQLGVQFHPEVSGPTGQRLLHNFVAWSRARVAQRSSP